MTTGRLTTAPLESSVLEILEDRAKSHPDRLIFCYLDEGEFETEQLTYGQLLDRSRAIAATLQQRHQPGDRVVLLYPPGLEFIAALFGCFAAGMIAVPSYPPRLELMADGMRPLELLAADCEPAAILVGGGIAPGLQAACSASPVLSRLHCIRSDEIDDAVADTYFRPDILRESPALLQYTSGSTGDPRGVIVTHGNLLANEHVIQLAFHHRTAEEPGGGVCWLPFYHDMGLIGNVIQAVYVDGPCYLMSPLVLLQRPVRWLEAITKYRAHSSGGPGFAFDLCVRRITDEQKAALDLSCWELAAIGAEPISHAVIDRFSNAFAACGFHREAFYPCYGLAEATLFVSGGDKESVPVLRAFRREELALRGARGDEADGEESSGGSMDGVGPGTPRQTLVGCGHAWTEHELAIADPETSAECPEGVIGEIWFRGPSVAAGYWKRERETEETFRARLSDSGRGPFLRTGDLGLIRDGELYVSGRLKDVIVIRGQNYYPQDIETTVSGVHESFHSHAVAAFGVPVDGEERLVVLQEIDRQSRRLDVDALRREVRRAVALWHQLQIEEVVFLRNATIPKTTSGKVRRSECRRRYLEGQLMHWKGKSGR